LEPIVLHCDSWREYGRADPALHSRPEREVTQVCMEKAYKFRIYPTSEQETLLQKTFGCARYVYNYYLNKRMTAYQKDKTTLNYYACSADLTRLKKEKDWLREPDKFALQSALRNLDDAYQRFFDRVKKGEAPGYPKFKSKHDRDRSYTTKFTNGNIKVLDKHVRLPKLGLVKCRVSRQVEGRILSATVSQKPSGKYFVSITCTDVVQESLKPTGAIVGIDLGLKELCITSDDLRFDNPKRLARSQKRLARLQRQLSRKPKGSKNRGKARIKVARLHEKVANQRRDAIHKLTTQLVHDYDLICMETLVPKNMVKNRKLAKAISDAAWGEVARQLEYKTQWYGRALIKVDRFYASSQTCSVCGCKGSETKNLAVREWDCPNCGAHHDRDVNAARNILAEGLRIVNAV